MRPYHADRPLAERSERSGRRSAAPARRQRFPHRLRGDLSALDLQALERVARVVAEPRREGRLLTMRLRLPSADSVRNALSLLNERVEIRGFEEIIPSMNDIFIRAVGGEL